jgi:hypothetical protein
MDHLLSRLAEALGFELSFIGSSNFIVDVDVVRRAPELLVKLSPIDDIIVAQGPDPRCPGATVSPRSGCCRAEEKPGIRRDRLRRRLDRAVTSLPPQLSEAEKEELRKARRGRIWSIDGRRNDARAILFASRLDRRS